MMAGDGLTGGHDLTVTVTCLNAQVGHRHRVVQGDGYVIFGAESQFLCRDLTGE